MKRTPHTYLGHRLSCLEMIGICHRKKKEEEKLKHSFQEPALKEKQAPGEPSEKDLENGSILLIIGSPFLLYHSVHFKMESKYSTKRSESMLAIRKTLKNPNVQTLYKHF